MLMIKEYFTFQEILNIYPLRAPSFPHDKTTASDWFTKMLDDAGMELAVYTLSEAFTNELIEDIINALMFIVYDRHYEDYLYKVITDNENYSLSASDFKKAIRNIVNVIDLTLPKYIPLLQQNEIYSTNPVAPIHSFSKGSSHFNDTPQNEGMFRDEDHASNESASISESEVDTGSIMERLSALFKDFKSIILEWSNEFTQCFLKEEQLC